MCVFFFKLIISRFVTTIGPVTMELEILSKKKKKKNARNVHRNVTGIESGTLWFPIKSSSAKQWSPENENRSPFSRITSLRRSLTVFKTINPNSENPPLPFREKLISGSGRKWKRTSKAIFSHFGKVFMIELPMSDRKTINYYNFFLFLPSMELIF